MISLVTSYLLQCKELNLPGIGLLKIVATPASTDREAKKILPPFQTVVFSRNAHSRSPSLVEYISRRQHISKEEAEEKFTSFCREWKEKLEAGAKMEIDTIGYLTKNGSEIHFVKEEGPVLFSPIPVESVYSKSNGEENRNENSGSVAIQKENVVNDSGWGLWALILLATGLVILFYHYRTHSFTGYDSGNANKIRIDSASATYRSK